MAICGPKLARCGVVLSAWGVIQLLVTGVLFHFRAAAFIEDVGLKGEGQYSTLEELSNDIDVKYETGAINCWIGALIYLVTFCLSMQQFYQHEKVSILNDIKSLRYGSVENSS